MKNISSPIDFNSEPLVCFQLKRWMYYPVLTVLFWMMIWTTQILLTLDTILEPRLATIPEELATNLLIMVYASVILDIAIWAFMIFSGLVANFTLKLNWYKAHETSIMLSVFSNLLVFYLNSGYFIILVIRVLSYMFVKLLISEIYSGTVYYLFKSIPNDFIRNRLETEFNKLKEGGFEPSTSNDYFSSLYYRLTLP